MNELERPAQQLVQDILEDIEDFDTKEVSEPTEGGYWIQIDGDANPWVHGGSWFNPPLRQVLHFEGIDQDGLKEIEPEDVKIPPEMLAKLPPEQEDWRENKQRDRIIDNYRYARAELLNNKKERHFWMLDIPHDQLPHWLRKYENHCPTGLDDQTWAAMPIENRMVELGRYMGFHEMAHPMRMNYYQARKLLGTSL